MCAHCVNICLGKVKANNFIKYYKSYKPSLKNQKATGLEKICENNYSHKIFSLLATFH